jgi:hypothetical protein
MHDDGKVKYAEYSSQELKDALASINPDKYPVNYGNLVSEISNRPEITENDRLQLLSKKHRSGISQTSKLPDWDNYYTTKSTIAALASAIAGLSNPDIYWLYLISLAIAASTYFALKKKCSKNVFLTGFVCLSFVSFLVGYFFFEGHRLTVIGVLAALFGILIAAFLTMFLSVNERDTTG